MTRVIVQLGQGLNKVQNIYHRLPFVYSLDKLIYTVWTLSSYSLNEFLPLDLNSKSAVGFSGRILLVTLVV